MNKLYIVTAVILYIGFFSDRWFTVSGADADSSKRRSDLEVLLKVLPPDRTSNGRVSFLDETFNDWLKRTGELPPDYDVMPSIPGLARSADI